MAASEVEIYNLALNAVGARNNVSAPDEISVEAETCHLWYALVRDQVLASAPWPEATKFDYLAQTGEVTDVAWASGDPRPGYSYMYELPSDCLRPQYLTDFGRFAISNSKSLHTNTYQAILVYTMQLETVAHWTAPLRMAIVYGLAANICMPLSGKPSRARMLVEQANANILSAREAAANTSDEVYEAIPDWIAARGYGDTHNPGSKFIYPYGSMLALTNVN